MAPIKRSRRAVESDCSDDEVIEVDEASSSFQASRKRARVSIAGPSKNGSRRHAESDREPSEDVDEASAEDEGFSPPRTQYERLRDADYAHLEHADEDFQKATQRLLTRSHLVGDNRTAENGIVESIRCTNFMCHEHLRVDLGPLINFIVGENGSGKSAVLTALTLCLGGKASSTNRGGSLKSFIKEGCDQALLEVRIKNQGDGAFQPELYGEQIIVERHFSRNNASGFRLKSAQGRTLSTKKLDVDEISDWFGLQVDNPLNILSQDNARQFLNASTPAQKYKFFVQGVQLEQLDNDYKLVAEISQNMEDKMESLEETLKAQEREYQAARRLREAVNKNQELRQRVRLYVDQMAWAQVAEQERKLEQREQAIEVAEQQVLEHDQDIVEREQSRQEAEEKIRRTQEALEALRVEGGQFDERIEQAHASYVAAKADLTQLHSSERDAHMRLKNAADSAKEWEGKIRVEEERVRQSTGSARLEKEEQLGDAKKNEEDIMAQLGAAKAKIPSLEQSKRDVENEIGAILAPRRQLDEDINLTTQRISRLQHDQGGSSKYAAFPPNTSNLVERIARDGSFQDRPVGPLGAHIQLLKPAWGPIIESTFGQTLNGFAVTNHADQKRLKAHADALGVQCPIIISPSRRLDLTNKEPAESFDTILRVLKFDNDLIRDTLILNNMIEQTILVEDRERGQAIMADNPRNVKACLTWMNDRRERGLRHTRNTTGGLNSAPINPSRRPPRMGSDAKEQLQVEQENMGRLAHQRREIQGQLNLKERESRRCDTEIKTAENEVKDLGRKLRNAQASIQTIEQELDATDGADSRLDVLREDHKRFVDERDNYGQRYGEMASQKQVLNKSVEGKKRELDAVRSEREEFDSKLHKAQTKVNNAETERKIKIAELNQAHESRDIAVAEKAKLVGKRDNQISLVESFVLKAQACSPNRVHIAEGETYESVQVKYKTLKAQLKKFEEKQGYSDQEIYARADKARANYEQARIAKETTESTLAALKATLILRLDKWRSFQRHISARARGQFSSLLSERGFKGDIILDHRARKLDLEVEPDETKKVSSGRSTKTLSGGEKSFSSICMLLAIWEAMGSPIRCLDEFDVFMDNINRAISTNLLIMAARRSVSKQYILITPNAIEGRAKVDKDVKIIRLTDPRQRRISDML